jgi:uncharacterized protein
LRALAPTLLSRHAVHPFLGYLQSQLDRLLGHGARQGMPHRPELVPRYGYDVKYASRALRLAYQGLTVARDGRLTLPMPAEERERVLAVKRGDVAALIEVVAQIEAVRAEVEAVLADRSRAAPPG